MQNYLHEYFAQDLYTISKKTYGTSRYAGVIAALNNVTNFGTYRAQDLFLPSLQDIHVYYESDTFTYPMDGYYVVKKGDTLESIAELVYEDASLASYLKEVDGIENLVEGMTIYIPAVEVYTK